MALSNNIVAELSKILNQNRNQSGTIQINSKNFNDKCSMITISYSYWDYIEHEFTFIHNNQTFVLERTFTNPYTKNGISRNLYFKQMPNWTIHEVVDFVINYSDGVCYDYIYSSDMEDLECTYITKNKYSIISLKH